MNWIGTIIDDRYRVENICSSQGGMSELFFVTDLKYQFNEKIVLKICTKENEDYIKRFKREIRLINQFQGNPRVVQVLDSNPDYCVGTPSPYFVMKYYENGDLTHLISRLINDDELQEHVFNEMIFCILELHKKNQFHRDIKPQNFLVDGESIIVSDLGLGIELNSSTRFTSINAAWGTSGYMPPEYSNGSFKNYEATGDIYMLGKSFYNLLTGRNPSHLFIDGISAPIFHIVTRCCEYEPNRRFQNLHELQNELKNAFDAILNRGEEISQILERIKNDKYSQYDIGNFIKKLSSLNYDEKEKIIYEIPDSFFSVLSESFVDELPEFIDSYTIMVKNGYYAFEYGQTITKNMKRIFDNYYVSNEVKANVLELAIIAANRTNRYDAMRMCASMIKGVNDEALGRFIYLVIKKAPSGFLSSYITPSECQSSNVKQALIDIHRE
jgi:serine/threonine protein kinase